MLTKTGEQLSFLAADLERFVLENLLEEVNTLVVLIRFDMRRSGRNEMVLCDGPMNGDEKT